MVLEAVVVGGAVVVREAVGAAGTEDGAGALPPVSDPNQRLTELPCDADSSATSAPQPVVGAASAVRVSASAACGAGVDAGADAVWLLDEDDEPKLGILGTILSQTLPPTATSGMGEDLVLATVKRLS